MLDEEQKKIRQEYESKFRDLEKDRMAVQDKKAQVIHDIPADSFSTQANSVCLFDYCTICFAEAFKQRTAC